MGLCKVPGLKHRLNDSIDAMQEYYPSFSREVINMACGRVAVWTGGVQPIQTDEHLCELIDDLDKNRPVYLPGGGRVIHHPYCIFSKHATSAWMKKVKHLYPTYTLKIKYSGGPENPRAYVEAPCLWIKNGQFRWMHMLEDGAICAYAPHHKIWEWQQHTVVDFMSHVLIWLVKWTVWDQTSIWIGAEAPHDRHSLLRNIDPNSPCRCGSGKEYGRCHREEDRFYVEENPDSRRSLSERITEMYPRIFC
jgi:hypothetical protein